MRSSYEQTASHDLSSPRLAEISTSGGANARLDLYLEGDPCSLQASGDTPPELDILAAVGFKVPPAKSESCQSGQLQGWVPRSGEETDYHPIVRNAPEA